MSYCADGADNGFALVHSLHDAKPEQFSTTAVAASQKAAFVDAITKAFAVSFDAELEPIVDIDVDLFEDDNDAKDELKAVVCRS